MDVLDILDDDGTGSSFVIKQHQNGLLDMPINSQGNFGGGNGDENSWQMIYPNQDTATQSQIDGVQSWLDGLANARNSNPDDIFTSYLDVETSADWILLNEFAKNIDGFHLSIHMYRGSNGLAHFVPWDFDLSMGQPTVQGEQGNETPEGWVINHSNFYDEMLSASALQTRIPTRWSELRQSAFADATVSAWLDSFATTLTAEAVSNNFAIWPIADVDFQQIYNAYTLYDVSSHAEEVSRLRAWVSSRLAWMDANVGNYPN